MVNSTAKKNVLTDFLRASLISIIIGAIFILVFAIVLNFFPLGEIPVTIINQVIKILSIFLGCLFGFKEKKNGILKGFLSGLLYSLGIALISAIINKDFSFAWGVLLDVGLGAVIGAICGILTVNFSRK